jgi:Na+/H+ antiporter NhaD/arsenite permease-like protein
MNMSDLQVTLTLVVFAGVILAIAFNIIDMAVAALLGVSVMLLFGIFTRQEFLNAAQTAGGSIALLFGGMVVARTLVPTGLFDLVGIRFLRATRGSGKRFLLGLIILTAPLCAFLPNATAVILLAPIVISVATTLKVDFVGPLVLTAIISNSAGLLTLVGDPATFLVGSSIGMTFGQYLQKVSIGGLLSVLVLVPLLPLVMRDIWRVKQPLPAELSQQRLERPVFCMLSLLVLTVMILLFLFGEWLPFQLLPPAVAIVGASLALLLIYGARVEPVDKVLKDVDWKTLLFLTCMFLMVEAFTRTGIIHSLSRNMVAWFGTDLLLVAMAMLVGVAAASSVLANIPVVAAMVLLVQGYFVAAELVPEMALGPAFADWPAVTLPVFVAMMFGGTLGGNATLIGASANVVSAGISASHGRPISFGAFARYGIPLTLCQITLSAVYVLALRWMLGR